MPEALSAKEGFEAEIHGRAFDKLPLDPRLIERLTQKGFRYTTIIQDLFLPPALEGKDVIVGAKQDSGKALGYIIVTLNRLLKEKAQGYCARGLILVPSPERAIHLGQIAGELAQGLDLLITPFAHPQSLPEEQFKALERGAEVVFTTPYWLNRALKWRILAPFALRIMVLDELDHMLPKEKGLLEDILRRLWSSSPPQGLIFLDTPDYPALGMAYTILREPEEIFLDTRREDFTHVKLYVIHVSAAEKLSLLLGLLRKYKWPQTIVFVNNKVEAQKLCETLKNIGLGAVYLKPDLAGPLRLNFLKLFSRGKTNILISTDATCRFIQQKGLNLIINYDLPETGDEFRYRASKIGEGGTIISLCDETGAFFLEAIEKEIKRKMEVIFPCPEEQWFLPPEQAKREIKGHRQNSAHRTRRPRFLTKRPKKHHERGLTSSKASNPEG